MEVEAPEFFDDFFRRKKKNGEWEIVNAPKLYVPLADSHAHVHMLSNPALALARAGLHNVGFIEFITDPTEDGTVVFDNMKQWSTQASISIKHMGGCSCCSHAIFMSLMRVAVGVHPHNASKFDDVMEAQLCELLHDSRVSALGEIGLDYHYDFSPRDVQREVFRKQIRIAKEADLPVVLHMREAHDDGFQILQEEGFPQAGVLLHCYNLGPEELQRWIDADCYVAFGGPLTFKKAEEVREAARMVPLNRILTETDAPYMAPEPLRGQKCEPAQVEFTAAKLCEVRGCENKEQRDELLGIVFKNTLDLLHRDPTPWQKESN